MLKYLIAASLLGSWLALALFYEKVFPYPQPNLSCAFGLCVDLNPLETAARQGAWLFQKTITLGVLGLLTLIVFFAALLTGGNKGRPGKSSKAKGARAGR